MTWTKKGNLKLKKGRKSRLKSAAEDPRSDANTTVHMLRTMVRMAHLVLRADLGWIDVR